MANKSADMKQKWAAFREKFRGAFAFWSVIALVGIVVVVTLVYKFSQFGGGMDPNAFPKLVDAQVIQPQAVDVNYTTQGTIEARNRIDMNAEVAGTVEAIYVSEGDVVEEGQVLMRLRGDRQVAQRQEAGASAFSANSLVVLREAEVKQAEADLDAAEASQELAASELKRYEELFKNEFVSALELDQKRSAYKTEKARYVSAQENLKRTVAQYAQANGQYKEAEARVQFNQAALDETFIRAPFSGRVGQKYVDLGDYVAPADMLITLVDSSQMKVAFAVPERFIQYLKTGLRVQAQFNGVNEAGFAGDVVFVDPAVDPENRTVMIKALLSHESPEYLNLLRDGQFTRVSLTLYTKPDGLVIPEEALVPQGEKFFVYISKPGEDGKARAVFKQVELGYRETGWTEVVSGLEPGDELVTSGLQKLFEGALLQKRGETE